MLKSSYQNELIEAGCDEAGRGCLAGPVCAAAVILPDNFTHPVLNDSKKLSAKQRFELRAEIEEVAISWAVEFSDNNYIDRYNILKASVHTMQNAAEKLAVKPQLLIVDGNYFIPMPNFKHKCIVKGDTLFYSIAAASILAKTYRDDFMDNLHASFPQYNWLSNKGYPTKAHRIAIQQFGITEYHRKSFNLCDNQLKLKF